MLCRPSGISFLASLRSASGLLGKTMARRGSSWRLSFSPSTAKNLMSNIFYTYAFLREDGTPYYIGKGKGDRAFRSRRGRVAPPLDKSRIIILKKNLSEDEAFRHECYMIAVFGRKDLGTGILWNFTDGGQGGAGKRMSEGAKEKISAAMTGKVFTDSHRQNISKAKKEKMTQETKEKIRQSHIGLKPTDETREKLRNSKLGDKNPNSRGLSEAHKQRIAEGQRRRWERVREAALYDD